MVLEAEDSGVPEVLFLGDEVGNEERLPLTETLNVRDEVNVDSRRVRETLAEAERDAREDVGDEEGQGLLVRVGQAFDTLGLDVRETLEDIEADIDTVGVDSGEDEMEPQPLGL